jgi:dTDP-4-amino-4,6-dideoxygalactose transaminase
MIYRDTMLKDDLGNSRTQWSQRFLPPCPARIVTLPLFPAMTDVDVDRVCDTVTGVTASLG